MGIGGGYMQVWGYVCICMWGRSCGVVVEERRRGAAGRLGLILGLGVFQGDYGTPAPDALTRSVQRLLAAVGPLSFFAT